MAIEILFTEADKQQVRDNHGEPVAERVCNAIEQKNQTLEWKSSLIEAKQRFYTVIEKNGECFPEMFFLVNRREYRALLAWIEEYEVFAFLCVVEKNDHYQTSRQHDLVEQVYKHPHRVVADATRLLDGSDIDRAECA